MYLRRSTYVHIAGIGGSKNTAPKICGYHQLFSSHNHVFRCFPRSSFTSCLLLLFPSHHLKIHQLFFSSSSSSSLLDSSNDLKSLKQAHASLIVSVGITEHLTLASKLISLYAQFHDLQSAISVFNTLQQPNSLTWNFIIKSHVDLGHFSEALFLFKKMRELGVKHDSFTFPIINQAVLSLRSDIVCGKMIHCVAIKIGFGRELYFCNTIMEVYGKSGSLCNACKVFDEMSQRDCVSWTSIISVFFSGGDATNAFKLFDKMRLEMEPNPVTLIVMLQGCCAFTEGRQLHGYVTKNGLLVDRSVQNSVLGMYGKMDCAKEVENVFTEIDRMDVVSWNTLINYHSLRGDVERVVSIFNQMQGVVTPRVETVTSVVSALAKTGNLMEGEKLHCFSMKTGICDVVLLNSFLDFYAKCGELRNAAQLFEEVRCRSSITWNAMMSGLIQNGFFDEAIGLFRQFQTTGCELGAEILGRVVDACAHLGALQVGKVIHGYLIRNLFFSPEDENMLLSTSILNMYIRCGSISSAREYFDRMPVKDIVTWSSMIEGYGIHGLGIEAVNLFYRMMEEGIAPNGVTILNLLCGCSHSGLVREGCEIFLSMKWMFGIEPNLDHYTCMVDLLSRSGKLKEALAIILRMTVFADGRIWGAILAASQVHGDGNIGEFAAQRLWELELDNVGYYTIFSNVQASTGRWTTVEEVRKTMHEMNLRKTPGWSYIEEKGRNYCFVSGDRSHKQAEEIYKVLRHLCSKLQDFVYV